MISATAARVGGVAICHTGRRPTVERSTGLSGHPAGQIAGQPLQSPAAMRDCVLLYLNGRRHELRGPDAFAPLSAFVRQTLGLTGTKVVCAEGDCGACAVLVGRPRDGQMAYQ